ncbi:MAG: S41 family peptidase [Nonlabens sp.]|nr:S41 family peptidase [Nonlabens sp.]
MKIKTVYIPIVIAAIFTAGLWLGNVLQPNDQFVASTSLKKRKLNNLIDIIDERYVEKIDTDSIVDVTVNEIMQTLDPHSVYIPVDDSEAVNNSMRGDFVGIGVQFYVRNDTIAVLNAIAHGPSKRAGIKAADRILYADSKPLFGKASGNTDILKGKKGSKVVLGILKPGASKITNITVTRDRMPLPSVDAAYMLTENLGYIKVNRFSETTAAEFDKAIDEIVRKGAQEMVLDLRDNPGGVLDAAISIADEFLKKGQLIVFQKDRNNKRSDSYATSAGSFENKKVYILINENSASASEVVAGALQDNDKGTIVGRRSFGKGLVQQEIKLGDGSAVRLTVARYYTPTGRSIQRPYDKGSDNYFNEYIERYENGELLDADNIAVNDSLKKVTPGGKVVYGGGGIIPDVFVASPSDYVSQTIDYYGKTGFADQYINRYLQKDGAYLRNMSLKDFMATYNPPLSLVQGFIGYAQLYNTSVKLPGYQQDIERILKASLASQLYGKEQSIKLLNERDTDVQKVIALSKKR